MSKIEEVKKLVGESGNNFHCKVTQYFKEAGWTTMVSPYYMDMGPDKPREIDLIVQKSFRVHSDFSRKIKKEIFVKLFIECKYLPKITAFWFAERDKNRSKEWVAHNTPFSIKSAYTQKHHYLSNNEKVAKLFATSASKESENEPIYKALNQCLNAMVYNRGQGSIDPLTKYSENVEQIFLEYPVIICNSFENVYRTELEETSEPQEITENFMLEVNYAYLDSSKNHRKEYFLIDVVSLGTVKALLFRIEDEIESLKIEIDD